MIFAGDIFLLPKNMDFLQLIIHCWFDLGIVFAGSHGNLKGPIVMDLCHMSQTLEDQNYMETTVPNLKKRIFKDFTFIY